MGPGTKTNWFTNKNPAKVLAALGAPLDQQALFAPIINFCFMTGLGTLEGRSWVHLSLETKCRLLHLEKYTHL